MLGYIRKELTRHSLQAYYLPHRDAHNNEFLGAQDHRVTWVSGFKGSNAETLVSHSEALLWTDARYWLAAEQQLHSGWTLMKQGTDDPKFDKWAITHLSPGEVVGFDPALVAARTALATQESLKEAEIEFQPVKCLVEGVWSNRPTRLSQPVFLHEFTEVSAETKLDQLSQSIKAEGYLTSVLDEIAWVLNLRGSDIPHTPVFYAYFYFNPSANQSVLFCDNPLSTQVSESLKKLKIKVQPYSEALTFFSCITDSVQVDLATTNYEIYSALQNPLASISPLVKAKAIKSPRELDGVRASHLRDAAAVCKFFSEVSESLSAHKELTEVQAAELLTNLRAKEAYNVGEAFDTISAAGPNGAIIHYRPEPATSRTLTLDQMYLLDSGGQYLDGTIDCTRTVHFGKPSTWQKECYTRVLLGNLDVERMKWPKTVKLRGCDIDVLARRHLWYRGLNYAHGTGHGVGYFLNVHEGPHSISKVNTVPLEEGMIVTNEPGYYEEGEFGIRIENILIVRSDPGDSNCLSFENVTNVPYDRNLIDLSLLSPQDVQYIDAYHQAILKQLSPVYSERNDQGALMWLERATAGLTTEAQ